MPINIIKDVPLPIPRCVICSPNHINSIVPTTKVITVVTLKKKPAKITTGPVFVTIASKLIATP